MSNTANVEVPSQLALRGETAKDLMTPNPISIRDNATIPAAIALFTDKAISAAPVIDEAGQPVGVVSQADILVHNREQPPAASAEITIARLESGASFRHGSQGENVDQAQVRDIMTPVIFSVAPDASARRVVQELLALKVHRLFVVDHNGVLIGVISAMDILQRLE